MTVTAAEARADIYLDASLISPVNIVARESDEPREWIFTFGSGHRAYAWLYSDVGNWPPASELGHGMRLDNRYVVIRGTFDEARARMVAVFGQVWCCQYGSRESAGVDQYGLVELTLTGRDGQE